MKSPAELTELFRQQGLKITPQRVAIFQALHGSEVHPSAEAVYESVAVGMPSISLRTVYQTLNDLASMGELVALDLGTGAARFDPNTDPHHHVVCDRCGKVRDIYADFTDVRLPRSTKGELHGFRVSSTEIVFRGLCHSCQHPGPDE